MPVAHPSAAPSAAVAPHPGLDNVLPAPTRWGTARRLTLIDPCTETPRAALPLADAAEVDLAVARARDWLGASNRPDPREQLARLIAQLETRRAALARSITEDIGAEPEFALSKQVEAGLDHLRATLAAAQSTPNKTEIAPGGHEVHHVPAGIAALITPWNWPLNQVALKVGGALAAGCAMILKPSELATGAALIFAEAAAAAGIPAAQFTVVTGDGVTGAALAGHPGIDILSFTGSTSVGRKIAATAGANLVPVLLELGGKSANILFEDCDVALATRQGVAHCFRNTGQSCNAASRMLVARAIYDQVLTLAQTEAARFDPDTGALGPLVSAAQFDRVQRHIDRALADGARAIAGGPGRPDGVDRGYHPRPTIFADVTPDMAIFRDEVFGPVLTITPFDTEADAIRLANIGDYGLAGYVQTADPARQRRVAEALQVGMVQLNGRSRATGAPFGGVGHSGFGREAGLWGIRAFQTVKSISGLSG